MKKRSYNLPARFKMIPKSPSTSNCRLNSQKNLSKITVKLMPLILILWETDLVNKFTSIL